MIFNAQMRWSRCICAGYLAQGTPCIWWGILCKGSRVTYIYHLFVLSWLWGMGLPNFAFDLPHWLRLVSFRQPPADESNGEAGEMPLYVIVFCLTHCLLCLFLRVLEAKKGKKTKKNQQILGQRSAGVWSGSEREPCMRCRAALRLYGFGRKHIPLSHSVSTQGAAYMIL